MEIKVHVEVTKETAGALNSGKDILEDILVLHLENGKDYYISFEKFLLLAFSRKLLTDNPRDFTINSDNLVFVKYGRSSFSLM